jgi:hypothetical protein
MKTIKKKYIYITKIFKKYKKMKQKKGEKSRKNPGKPRNFQTPKKHY